MVGFWTSIKPITLRAGLGGAEGGEDPLSLAWEGSETAEDVLDISA